MQVLNTIALKMVKVSKLAQRKLIPHRSITGLGHFEKLNILEIFPDSYCAITEEFDHKVKIIKKYVFAVLLIHNINPTAEKSSEN